MDEQYVYLLDEINVLLQKVKGMEYGSEEYKKAIDSLETLMSIKIKFENAGVEADIKTQELEIERLKAEFEKDKQLHDEKFKMIEIGVAIVGILAPIISYDRNFAKGLRFETDGVITSRFFGNHANKAKMK